MQKKYVAYCLFFLTILLIPITKSQAEYKRNVSDWGWSGNRYTCGTECDRKNLIKLEISDLKVDGNNVYIEGIMLVLQKQNYFDSNDHEYLFEIAAGDPNHQLSAYWRLENVTVDRTITHRVKNDLSDGSYGVFKLPYCKTSPNGGESDYFPDSASCDRQYRSVGFKGTIPVTEIAEFLESVGEETARMKIFVWNKAEGHNFNGKNIYYEEVHTVIASGSWNTSDQSYKISLNTGSNNAKGQVIEDDVIVRGMNGHNGGTLTSETKGGLYPAYNKPVSSNKSCNSGYTSKRIFFTFNEDWDSNPAPKNYNIVNCSGNSKYCKGAIPNAWTRNYLNQMEQVSESQAGYLLEFYCLPEQPNVDRITVYDESGSGRDGPYKGWVAASAFRVTGQATTITVKPNKRLWVDQVVSPTQECNSSAKLLVKAHCDPCSADSSDEIKINWGGKTKTLTLRNLPTTANAALNGAGYVISFDGSSCSHNQQKQVHIVVGNDKNEAGKLQSTGYIPEKSHVQLACNNVNKQAADLGNVVLTSKFADPNRNRPDDRTQPWLYRENIHIQLGDLPGTINAGRGFEYPVGYIYTVDDEVKAYSNLFPSGSFEFKPKTKFYTTNLTSKLDEAYPKQDVSSGNVAAVTAALRTVYSASNYPYTITYKNSEYTPLEVMLILKDYTLGKTLEKPRRNFVYDYTKDGSINNLDMLYVQDVDLGRQHPAPTFNNAQLPTTYIEKGSGYVYANKSKASLQPTEDGGNKIYTKLDSKQGGYFFSVSGESIGFNQYSFVLPKCEYVINCNPLSEKCEELPGTPPNIPDNPDNPDCPSDPREPQDPDCPRDTQAVFRMISVNDPFPGRTPGPNWNNAEARRLIRSNVYESAPEYGVVLNHTRLTNIQQYNRNYSYLYYKNMYPDPTKHIWRTTFVDNSSTYGVTRYH